MIRVQTLPNSGGTILRRRTRSPVRTATETVAVKAIDKRSVAGSRPIPECRPSARAKTAADQRFTSVGSYRAGDCPDYLSQCAQRWNGPSPARWHLPTMQSPPRLYGSVANPRVRFFGHWARFPSPTCISGLKWFRINGYRNAVYTAQRWTRILPTPETARLRPHLQHPTRLRILVDNRHPQKAS